MQRADNIENRAPAGGAALSSDPTTMTYGNRQAAGNLPSTEVIADALHTTEAALHDTSVRPPPELNAQGRRLLTDLENVTASNRRFIEEKNPDNIIQQIMAEGRLAVQEMQNEMKNGQLKGLDKESQKQMTEQANTVLADIQNLAMETMSSSTFRTDLLNLLECFALIAQEITGIEVTKMTEPLRGAQEELQDAHEQGGKRGAMESAKGKVNEVAQGAKEMAQQTRDGEVKPLDKKQLDRLTEKLRQTMEEIGKRPKTRRVFEGMFNTFNLFTSHYAMQENKEQAKEATRAATDSVHWNNMTRHVRILVERFAGEETVTTLINHVNYIIEVSKNDPELKDYFIEIRDFVKNTLDSPGYFVEDGPGEKELEKMIKRGRKLFAKKELREHFIGTINYAIQVVQNFMNDPHLSQMQSDIAQFVKDLVTDDAGNIVITKNALNQLRVILVSSLLERMAIPIPMITHEDPKMEFEISNLWLVLKDVIPDMVHLEYREAFDVDTSDLRGKGVGLTEGNQLIVHAMNMKYSMKDANIWWKRKKFPKSEDSGILDMNMPGEGIELRIVLSLKLNDPQGQIFSLKSVDCDIDKINLKLTGTKHDKMYNAFLKVAKGSMKKRVETAIEEKIADIVGMLNGQVSRSIVSATLGNKNRIIGNISSKIENVTGVNLAPALTAERSAQQERDAGQQYSSGSDPSSHHTTVTTDKSATTHTHHHDSSTHTHHHGSSSHTHGTTTTAGAPGGTVVRETVTVTNPDGTTSTTVREVPHNV